MFGLIGTAIGISIMARVANGVCRSMERTYSNNNYRRYNNYRKNPYKRPQRTQTQQQRLPLQHKQKQLQQPQKPRYSYKSTYNKNRKQPYWKFKMI